jgi:hypothetical protein
MDKLLLKTALSDIWALVYLSQTRDLDLEQFDKLREAVNAVKRGWSQTDPFRGCASMLCGDVRSSGILSLPPSQSKTPKKSASTSVTIILAYVNDGVFTSR